MKSKYAQDIRDMHDKFGVHVWMAANIDNQDALDKFLQFRLIFLQEELNETQKAFEEGNREEIVDGLIDLMVVALGTLDAFNVNADRAWDAVHQANMAKEVGIKDTRPNPLGLPDLVKPEGWVAPSHKGNVGIL